MVLVLKDSLIELYFRRVTFMWWSRAATLLFYKKNHIHNPPSVLLCRSHTGSAGILGCGPVWYEVRGVKSPHPFYIVQHSLIVSLSLPFSCSDGSSKRLMWLHRVTALSSRTTPTRHSISIDYVRYTESISDMKSGCRVIDIINRLVVQSFMGLKSFPNDE